MGRSQIARGWDLPVTVEAGNAGVDLGAARFCEECQQICYTGATEFWSRPHHLAEIRKNRGKFLAVETIVTSTTGRKTL